MFEFVVQRGKCSSIACTSTALSTCILSFIHIVSLDTLLCLWVRTFSFWVFRRMLHFDGERIFSHFMFVCGWCSSRLCTLSSKCKQVVYAKGNKGMRIFISFMVCGYSSRQFSFAFRIEQWESEQFRGKTDSPSEQYFPEWLQWGPLYAIHFVPSHFRWSTCLKEQVFRVPNGGSNSTRLRWARASFSAKTSIFYAIQLNLISVTHYYDTCILVSSLLPLSVALSRAHASVNTNSQMHK